MHLEPGWLQRAFHLTPREGKGLTLVSFTLADQLPQAQSETSSMNYHSSSPGPGSKQIWPVLVLPQVLLESLRLLTALLSLLTLTQIHLPWKLRAKLLPMLSSNFFCLLLDLSTFLCGSHGKTHGALRNRLNSRRLKICQPDQTCMKIKSILKP